MKLTDLLSGDIGEVIACVDAISGHARLQEMGVIPGSLVRMIKKTPLNGPIEIKVNEFYLSLRKDLAEKVEVKKRS